jgi:hypothetical protein
MFLLYVTDAAGYVQVVTFPTAFARALTMIYLARSPVVLRIGEAAA